MYTSLERIHPNELQAATWFHVVCATCISKPTCVSRYCTSVNHVRRALNLRQSAGASARAPLCTLCVRPTFRSDGTHCTPHAPQWTCCLLGLSVSYEFLQVLTNNVASHGMGFNKQLNKRHAGAPLSTMTRTETRPTARCAAGASACAWASPAAWCEAAMWCGSSSAAGWPTAATACR